MEHIFKNEKDIIDFFSDIKDTTETLNKDSFKVEQWPDLIIKDPDKDMVISYSFMQSLTVLQEEIYRSYSLIYHNSCSKKLSEDEKKALQIRVKVKPGCTEFIVNGAEIVKRLISSMTNNQIFFCVILFIMCYFSKDAFSQFSKDKKDSREKEIEAEKYNKTIEALSKLSATSAEIYKRSLETKKEIIKPLSVNKLVQIGETAFTQEEMENVLKKDRASFSQTRLDGFYVIEKVEQTDDLGFKCSLCNEKSSFNAILQGSLFNELKLPIIQKSLFERKSIYCKVNAKIYKTKLKDAELIDVSETETPYKEPNLTDIEEVKDEE